MGAASMSRQTFEAYVGLYLTSLRKTELRSQKVMTFKNKTKNFNNKIIKNESLFHNTRISHINTFLAGT